MKLKRSLVGAIALIMAFATLMPVHASTVGIPNEPVKIRIDSTAIVNIGIGQSMELYASIAPYDHDHMDIIWASTKPTVIRVDQNGSIKGLKGGMAIISASTADGTSKSTITVRAGTGLKAPADSHLADLTVNGETVKGFQPAVFTYDTVVPVGSIPEVKAVAADPKAAVTITQSESTSGQATVVVTAADKKATRTYLINMTGTEQPQVILESVPATLSVAEGSSTGVSLSAEPKDALIRAESDNKEIAVASVENSELTIDGLSAGTATITITAVADGYRPATYEIQVTVTPSAALPNLVGSENAPNVGAISQDSIQIVQGRTYAFTVDTANNQNAGLVSTAANVGNLVAQLDSRNGEETYRITDNAGTEKAAATFVVTGDKVIGSGGGSYEITVDSGALRAKLSFADDTLTVGSEKDLVLNFHAGQRAAHAEVDIYLPAGINATESNTTVNVIGRGEIELSGLNTQSVGRYGEGYTYTQVGRVELLNNTDGSQVLKFSDLDLRPDNGIDLQLRFRDVKVNKAGEYAFKADYTTTEPDPLRSPLTVSHVQAVSTVTSFARVLDKSLAYNVNTDYRAADFTWSPIGDAQTITMMYSTNKGVSWEIHSELKGTATTASVSSLTENQEHWFRLEVTGGAHGGTSNTAKLFSGMYNAKTMGGAVSNGTDCTSAVNAAIEHLSSLGGGTLLFAEGNYGLKTVLLQSNVYLYVDKSATINALRGGDAPELTWFSDKDYRTGTSPTDIGPYRNPDNWMSKQDVGHTYWRNSMFYGQRLDNIKIIGNGRINGNGNLVTGDGVMNNSVDNRTDKMVALKLCTNFEFGGIDKGKDLWYEETASPNSDEPFYLNMDKSKDTDISNMLRVARPGHFVVMATGTDGINTHDTYSEKSSNGVRDIFDYMSCNDVRAVNIYDGGSGDDIIKPGSDCSLGFTRPATNFLVRNIIGDTGCNLFQIGSETADDIQNICVDNLYILAASKAGFSISTNDGGHIKNIHLNCGGTVGQCSAEESIRKTTDLVNGINLGYTPSDANPFRSEMRRTRTPFFLSISNRGRTIGGDAENIKFMENGKERNELLSKNVKIGYVENIIINDINIEEVYEGSRWNSVGGRWQAYNNQNKATPIIAGYAVPANGFQLPDGRQVGYIENVIFNNVDVKVKGGNPLSDSELSPPELGIGQYNIRDLQIQPSYGFWARHVDGLTINNCTVNFEKNDDRFAIMLDDVKNASIDNVTMVKPKNNSNVIKLKNVENFNLSQSSYYENTWGNGAPILLENISGINVSGIQTYPSPVSDSTGIAIKAGGELTVHSIDNDGKTVHTLLDATVPQLLSAIEAANGSSQTYRVYSGEGEGRTEKTTGAILPGDSLYVRSESGAEAYYALIPTPSSCVDLHQLIPGSCAMGIDNTARTLLVVEGSEVVKLLAEITSTDGSVQKYAVTGKSDGDLLETGDVLIVTAADGVVSKSFTITISEDIRITTEEDNLYVCSILDGTVTVFAGTTPLQLESSIRPLSPDNVLTFRVLDAEENEKTQGSLVETDLLEVSKGNTSVRYTIELDKFTAGSLTVTASSSEAVNVAENVVDGDRRTRWAASSGTYPQWIQVDLGEVYSLEEIQTEWYNPGNRYYRYTVKVSRDGINYETVADHQNNNSLQGTVTDLLDESPLARYVRIDASGANGGSASIYEIRISGPRLHSGKSPITNLKTIGNWAISVDNDTKVIAILPETPVAQLLSDISSSDGSKQTYSLRDGDGLSKITGVVEPSDTLQVTANDGAHSTDFTFTKAEETGSTQLALKELVDNPVLAINNYERTVTIKEGSIAGELKQGIQSSDDTEQTYMINRGDVTLADEELLLSGDTLRVTAEDGLTSAVYIVTLESTVPVLQYDLPLHRVSGEHLIEPGTTVGNLSSFITAGSVPLAFTVTGEEQSEPRGDDDLILHGDSIKISSNSVEIETITANVCTEIWFATDREITGTEELEPYVALAPDSKIRASSDTIRNNSSYRVSYVQASGPFAGDWCSITTQIPADAQYRLDLVYKAGNRSEIQCYFNEMTEAAVIGGVLDTSTTNAPVYLPNLPNRNRSKAYHIAEIEVRMDLDAGEVTFFFEQLAAKDYALLSVQITLIGEAG